MKNFESNHARNKNECKKRARRHRRQVRLRKRLDNETSPVVLLRSDGES